ncbi:Hypothetical protein LOCK900_1961 [Lacticaseibacillus rhamnosus LOCK900]|nr:Hypothetical protein LOCK900_1961 [Lacticaseibacillus rhamnosus LOCK900]EHJ27591.1 hypothetical protein HMPREF0541_02503 [Lacticaseibacillus rhamnosus ATCC 21052]
MDFTEKINDTQIFLFKKSSFMTAESVKLPKLGIPHHQRFSS